MDETKFFSAVSPDLVGDNKPSVQPGNDPTLFGSATLTPTHPVEVRSFQTFTVTYKVGRIGLDDTGGIRVCFRMISDFGKLQLQTQQRQITLVRHVAAVAISPFELGRKDSALGR